jgi:translocator protein
MGGMNSRTLKWTNLVVFLATIAMNAAAVLLPLAGRTTQEISQRFEHLFTPANYTFSVWSVIYALLLVNAVDSLRRPDPEDAHVNRARGYLIAANLLNTLWLVTWHNLLIGLSLPVMGLILGCLIAAYANLERAPLTGWAHYAQRAPVAAYLGWISVATIANAGNLLVSLGWNGAPLEANTWAAILALVAGTLGVFLARTRGGVFYCATLAWGLLGVINRPSSGPALVALSVALGVIALSVLSRLWRPATPVTRRAA